MPDLPRTLIRPPLIGQTLIGQTLLTIALVLLAAPPAMGIVSGWFAPEPAPARLLVVALVVGLSVRSVRSGKAPHGRPGHATGCPRATGAPMADGVIAAALLAAGRLAAEGLDDPRPAALALPALVWLAARRAGLDSRRQPISPVGLAALSLFALPMRPALQDVAGPTLQQITAGVACTVLTAVTDDASCDGLRLHHAGVDLLVVPSCAGVGALCIQLMLVAVIATVRPGTPLHRLAAMAVQAVVSAIVANGLRVSAIAYGAVHAPVDLFAAPWHASVGLLALAAGSLPTLIWARGAPSPSRHVVLKEV